jgi:polyhydroxybutyrate depolymerase
MVGVRLFVTTFMLVLLAGGCAAAETLIYRHQGIERTAELYRPNPARAGPLPLVIALHGIGQNLKSLRGWLPLEPAADRDGFVLAYPVAIDLRWSYGRPVIRPMPAVGGEPVDDIGFLRLLIDDLVTKKIADPARIYVTGMSRGGLMAYTVACALADRVAATAPLITGMTEYQRDDCKPARVTPMLVIAGTRDPSEPFNGVNWPMGRLLSVRETMNYWRTLRGCERREAAPLAHRQDSDPTRVLVVTWVACKDAAPLKLYRVNGGGHRLPSLDDTPEPSSKYGLRNRDFDTAETVWAFFKSLAPAKP